MHDLTHPLLLSPAARKKKKKKKKKKVAVISPRLIKTCSKSIKEERLFNVFSNFSH
jgi:hypothetical protein